MGEYSIEYPDNNPVCNNDPVCDFYFLGIFFFFFLVLFSKMSTMTIFSLSLFLFFILSF